MEYFVLDGAVDFGEGVEGLLGSGVMEGVRVDDVVLS